MGILLTVKGADFSAAAIGFVPPVANGLEYWNFFGNSASDKADGTVRSARNLVVGKPGAGLVGAPVHAAGYSAFSPTAYVQTATPEVENGTFLIAGRPSATAGFGFCLGTFTGGSDAGSSIYFDNSGTNVKCSAQRIQSDTTATVQVATLASQGAGSWGFYSGMVEPTQIRLRNLTGGTLATHAAPAGSTRKVSARMLRAGSAYSNDAVPKDLAFAAYYSRILSDAELDAIYARVQAYLATKSIVV
jgi:hypothetical protein